MNAMKERRAPDILAVVSALSITIFIGVLFMVAATDAASRRLITMVIVGLGAGGVILFRQLRKAAKSLIASEARAHYAATHDEATHLPNKALFLERLAGVRDAITRDAGGRDEATEEGVAVFCIGLDRFEEVSEGLGYGVSAEVMAQIAGRLGSVHKEQDTLARLGDDLFGLIWTGASRRKAEALSAQLIKLLAAPYRASAGLAFITCSIGVGFLTSDLDDSAEALRHARLALSRARALGGAHISMFEPAMDRALKTRKTMEIDLRRALADDQLYMVYQPQVNARGIMVGVEALMRWDCPERGAVSPAVFVPLAESCGLSEPLGRFALRRAFEDARKWPTLKVAVNISAAQVRSGLLIPYLRALIEETGANPKNFELEITEGVLLADEAETFETLSGIRKLGFSLALDDFGTGYSSLSYLRRFPIDKIKIDKSFVSHLGQRPESDAIVKAIVDLADALELKVIAEGVETKTQLDRLAVAGCTNIQGFFFSQPVDAGAIDGLISGRMKLAA